MWLCLPSDIYGGANPKFVIEMICTAFSPYLFTFILSLTY